MLENMLEFIRENDTCVLATSKGREPHTSLMAYLPGEQGRMIYLITSAETLKYRNILANPQVSLLIDDRLAGEPSRPVKALTVVGVCAPAPETKQEALKARFAARMPHLAGITADPAAKVLVVAVRSLQLLAGPTESSFVELD
ncbi:MAG: pyridoxamine 5'-phosphate oxidase family protein [Desulfarculaceae bacterium]|nr:pyridoxamine 5'-phosphate oxidase family protein [Desulfarculaceae bacterium]MCF8046026.1 pyridoxamine 5'-phosphate oxidase family protein [Desulfarculaceae bacterium]MCF8064177.1 pyridoxamine 5'-phosphate oxidase family protein [Desulfarculaceae bacterium]MCF8098473.1 pyridoxamine 5'-phosphate oxidase family protein [Desulfarculaceae bacterium]MCF8123050.1 pyridoxamine 5'-phosphate oxidase family protein [Desulfarculaceae bacterium]